MKRGVKELREGERYNGKEPAKITPLNAHRFSGEEDTEPDISSDGDSLGELLIHMRRVRETIPVNDRLRKELRARLAGMQTDSDGNQPQSTAAAAGTGGFLAFFKGKRGAWPKYLWLFPAALLIAAFYWTWWSMLAPKALEAGPARELSRLWLEGHPLEFTCAPQTRGFLAVRDGSLQLLDQYGNQTGGIKPAKGQLYASPALNRAGDKLALIRRYEEGGEEIITAGMPAVSLEAGAAQQVETALSRAEVLLKVEQGKSLSDLAWSPDGQTLAYTLGVSSGYELYLLAKGIEPVPLGAGRHPAWSPDGSRLVVERTGEDGQPELWLISKGGGDGIRLAEGEQPAWSSQGYLAFVRVETTERVLTYNLDGSPLFAVRQRQGEIRAANLGRNGELLFKPSGILTLPGERLLLASDARPGVGELNWLRKLELEGVRETRTLLMDPLNYFQNIRFSPDGKALLAARRDGGTVALVQVSLYERLTKWGDH